MCFRVVTACRLDHVLHKLYRHLLLRSLGRLLDCPLDSDQLQLSLSRGTLRLEQISLVVDVECLVFVSESSLGF
jgi:hypothetical protein